MQNLIHRTTVAVDGLKRCTHCRVRSKRGRQISIRSIETANRVIGGAPTVGGGNRAFFPRGALDLARFRTPILEAAGAETEVAREGRLPSSSLPQRDVERHHHGEAHHRPERRQITVAAAL